MITLKAYEERTREHRSSATTSQLFIATIKPDKGVASSTIARWLKAVLTSSGIDTSISKSHTIRGATTTAAENAGVTTILNAADWSSESVFQQVR